MAVAVAAAVTSMYLYKAGRERVNAVGLDEQQQQLAGAARIPGGLVGLLIGIGMRDDDGGACEERLRREAD